VCVCVWDDLPYVQSVYTFSVEKEGFSFYMQAYIYKSFLYDEDYYILL